MMLPLLEQEGANRFIYTKLPEAFMIYLKISLVVACLLSLPVFLYHLGTFLLPGLYLFEAKRLGALVLGAVVLMGSGMVFCHQCLVPTAWEFFLSMGTQEKKGFRLPWKLAWKITFTSSCRSFLQSVLPSSFH